MAGEGNATETLKQRKARLKEKSKMLGTALGSEGNANRDKRLTRIKAKIAKQKADPNRFPQPKPGPDGKPQPGPKPRPPFPTNNKYEIPPPRKLSKEIKEPDKVDKKRRSNMSKMQMKRIPPMNM